jgi:hypothetical protein
MIRSIVNDLQDLDEHQKDILCELCQKIYMKESAVGSSSKQQLMNEIKGEIALKADKFQG